MIPNDQKEKWYDKAISGIPTIVIIVALVAVVYFLFKTFIG